ncbi:MAG: flagellar hook-basal body complex protein [Candidatus Scalindua sp.]|nr:flagellar hook-basal body complex protein [Candidatus Scalindua sp.]MCR4343466.1 flagellar hook-basal body complex protein [Candidatus Scalindua sp.]
MSTSSLVAGISGLKTSQVSLNVIGDNLANLNTSGFKASRVNFANELSQTIRSAQSPSGGIGGRNPIQIGTGTTVSSIDKDYSQGNMTPTGRPTDLAIQGDGFFMLTNSFQDFYTRVGSFNLDKNNDLVDSGTGLKVKGTSGTGINVPVNSTVAGKATTKSSLSGNLNSEFTTGAVNQVMTSGPYTVVGTGTTRVLTGSIDPTASTSVTGVGTAFTTELAVGDKINVNGEIRKVVTITSDTALTVDGAFTDTAADAALTAGTGVLTGSIDPAASTTVTGVGTLFTKELAVGDQITVSGETRTISAIASDTSLTVTVATTDTANDTSVMTDSMAVAGLNDLTLNTTDYVAGDKINVVGTEHNGTTLTQSFVYGTGTGQDGITLGALRDFITSNFGTAAASIDTSGNMLVTADPAGQSELSINITDATANTGVTAFSSFTTSTAGTGDVYVTSIPVFDTQGSSHLISLTFEKTASNTWDLTPTMKATEGSVSDAVTAVTFNADGSFSSITGTSAITITYPDATTQTITLDFGTPNTFGGITQFGGTSSAASISQDGHEEGFFSSTTTNPDGTVIALFTNGETKTVGQLQLVTFSNPAGLSSNGNNLLSRSLASGEATLTTAQSGRVGSILSGVLESSNVDIAEEFTKLIVSQRAFQANSRTITTTDEMLKELVNIVR